MTQIDGDARVRLRPLVPDDQDEFIAQARASLKPIGREVWVTFPICYGVVDGRHDYDVAAMERHAHAVFDEAQAPRAARGAPLADDVLQALDAVPRLAGARQFVRLVRKPYHHRGNFSEF